jgi:hypothetical protein
MDELAAVKYCVEVLEAREEADPARAWLWGLKRKVALYCLRALDDGGGRRHWRLARRRKALAARLGLRREPAAPPASAREAQPLTEEEKQLIRQTHPLLQDTRARSPHAGLGSHCQWYIEIRRKVGAFAEAWKERHGPSAGESG